MDTAMIRSRIEAVWDELPAIFTTRDVLRLIRKPKEAGSTVRAVLDAMVGEGLLFQSLMPDHRLGRKPSAWTKERHHIPEEVVLAAVRAVLPGMPSEFTVRELLEAARMTERNRMSVRGALDRLADESLIINLSIAQGHVGRPPQDPMKWRWTADSRRIAEEIAFRSRMAMVRQTLETNNNPATRLERLLRPWDPLQDDPVERLFTDLPIQKE